MCRLFFILAIVCSAAQSAYAQGGVKQLGNEGITKGMSRSVGVSGQFSVYGHGDNLNKAVSSLCDEINRDFHKLIGEKPMARGFVPVEIVLYSEGKAPKGVTVKTSVFQVEGIGYKIRQIIDIREVVDKSVIESSIVEGLIIARTLKTQEKIPKDQEIKVPRWVKDGVYGAIEWKEDRVNRGMAVLLKNKPQLYPLTMLLSSNDDSYKKLSVTNKGLHQVSASAMILSMHHQVNGKKHLANFMGDVAAFDGEIEELLRKHFPDMNVGDKALTKLWNLQLANMAEPRLTETNGILETEKNLEETLVFVVQDEDGLRKKIPITEYRLLDGLNAKDRSAVVLRTRQKLTAISFRSFPTYRPILRDYATFLNLLAGGVPKAADEKLKRLADARLLMKQQGQRMKNVLDWYNISQARELVGDFAGYQALLDRMDAEKKEQRPL